MPWWGIERQGGPAAPAGGTRRRPRSPPAGRSRRPAQPRRDHRRPSELVNLTKDRIKLDANIPHIRVEAQDRDDDTPGRELKTEQSERDIPLVGFALEGMRRHPDWIPALLRQGREFLGSGQQAF